MSALGFDGICGDAHFKPSSPENICCDEGAIPTAELGWAGCCCIESEGGGWVARGTGRMGTREGPAGRDSERGSSP